MKKLFTFLCVMFLGVSALLAQAPEMFSYQAVVRNADNHLVVNQSVSVRVSILQGSINGVPVMVETHQTTTNGNGLMTIQIGEGTTTTGSMTQVEWGSGPYFLKTEIDPNGGSNYSIESTQQLMSVPYALYAKEAGNGFSGDYNDLTNQPQIPTVPTNVSAFTNDAGYLTNFVEQQVLSISNDTVFLTGGSFVKLPAFPTNLSQFTNDMNYVTTLDVQEAAGIPTVVSAFINDAGYLTSYTEQQVLSISNDTIYLTGGSFVKLPAGFDGNYNSLTNKPELFSGNYNDLTNKPTIPTVPTNVSAFTNDAGYITNNACDGLDFCALTALVSQMQQLMNDMRHELDSLLGISGHDTSEVDTTSGGTITVTVPIVTTGTVSDIAAFSASCGGTVVDDGGATVTARGVCWSTSQNPTVSNSHTTDGTGVGAFTSSISGLAASTTYYVRAYATNSAGTAYGSQVTFTTLSSVPDGQSCPGMPTVSDYDGNVYNTVKIGTQCWMKENLKTTHYANGASIELGNSLSNATPYRYYPSGNSMNVANYGYLYNWAAVMNGSASSTVNPSGVQGICPAGWHVPSDAEWTQLTDYVSSQSEYLCSNDSAFIAKALAATTLWNTYNADCVVGNNLSSNNATGFSAVPAGSFLGTYSGFGTSTYFWSATESNNSSVMGRHISHQNVNVGVSAINKTLGQSVRCIHN